MPALGSASLRRCGDRRRWGGTREEQACGPLPGCLALAREASGFAGPDERQPLGSNLRPGMQGALISSLCPGGMMRGNRGQWVVGSLLSHNIISTETPVYSHEPGTQRHVVASVPDFCPHTAEPEA